MRPAFWQAPRGPSGELHLQAEPCAEREGPARGRRLRGRALRRALGCRGSQAGPRLRMTPAESSGTCPGAGRGGRRPLQSRIFFFWKPAVL